MILDSPELSWHDVPCRRVFILLLYNNDSGRAKKNKLVRMIWNKAPRKQEGVAIAAEAAVAITIQRVVSSKHTSSTLRAVFWQTKGGQRLGVCGCHSQAKAQNLIGISIHEY
jgi:hypothetical protein